jgi:predicted unusual protein kinase regulating ubiquinone biosynthesis (AarF/ABC1/UbiB family)
MGRMTATAGTAPPRSRSALPADGRMPLALYALGRMAWLALLTLAFLPQLAFSRRRAPVVLRRYLQACEGAFVKLGQVLAMRCDLLPEAHCDELARLLDRVPPAPLPAIERVITEDIGRPLAA